MRAIPFDPIIADAYRQAALDGLDMYVFAGQMDRLKPLIAAEADLYKQWDRLDDLIGEALWTNQDARHLLAVRQLVFAALPAHFSSDILSTGTTIDNDWTRWRTAFSEASFHWQVEALQALCQSAGLDNRFGDRLEPYRQFIGYFRDRRWVEARTVFDELANDPALPGEQRGYHHYVCGQIDLYFHYQYEQAKELFAAAEKLLAGKPLAFHGWIEYYLKSTEKDIDRAAAYAEKALELDASHAPSLIQKADVLAEKGQLNEAEKVYVQARDLRPGHATVYTRLMDLYGKPGLFEQKNTELESLAQLDAQLEPGSSYLTWTDLGTIYQQQGKEWHTKAKDCLQKACDMYPHGITPLLNLGYFYLDTQAYDEADKAFQTVVKQAPEAREGYLARARLAEAQEQWEKATGYYEQVQQIIPTWERFMLTSEGRCRRKLEQWDVAESTLLKAWAMDEHDDSGAMTEIYELAEQYYKRPADSQPDQAVGLLDRAARTRQGAPGVAAGVVNRQGNALFYAERYDEALPYYQKAAAIKSDEPVYFLNQADCLDKLYRNTRSEEHFQQALDALEKAAALAPQDSAIPKKRRQLSLVRYNPHLAELPELNPIHVEVGHPLLDQITQDFQTLLPEMVALTDALRQRMNERYGVNLPHLRYRDIAVPEGVFQFRLYETPVLRDQLPADPEHPPTMSAVLDQLEWFLTNYGLDLLINYWDVDREVPLLANAELVHFTRTIMALLAERIPLPPLPRLHQHYRRLDGPRLPVAEVVEKLRMLDIFRSKLPGIQADYHYCRLGEREEQLLSGCLIGQGDQQALALPFDIARGLLGAITRMAEQQASQHIVLVTQQAGLRPFLRSVLAGLPQIPVLKTAELPAGADARYLEPLTIREDDEKLFAEALQQFHNFATAAPSQQQP